MRPSSGFRTSTPTPYERLPDAVKERHRARIESERRFERAFRKRRQARVATMIVLGTAATLACSISAGATDPWFVLLFGLAGAAAAGFVGFKGLGVFGGLLFYGCLMEALWISTFIAGGRCGAGGMGIFRFCSLWLALMGVGGFLGYMNESRL